MDYDCVTPASPFQVTWSHLNDGSYHPCRPERMTRPARAQEFLIPVLYRSSGRRATGSDELDWRGSGTRFTMSLMRYIAMSLFVLTAVLACRSGQSGSPSRPHQGPRDKYLVLAAELEAVGRDNLYDAVRQARPGWFTRSTRNRTGDGSILVYFDDQPVGNATALRRFSTHAVDKVRYLSPTEAQVRYGQTNVGRPAILVETARR